jgi:hypothetical protein
MLKGSGKDFDPILLKVFINILGVYPVGTLLKLDTGELGLVVDCQKNGGKFVQLSAKHPETGSFKRNIVRSFHPSSFGLQPADFIL